MINNEGRQRGRPPFPAGMRKRFVTLAVVLPEDLGLSLKAEARARGISYSAMIKTYIEQPASKQEAA